MTKPSLPEDFRNQMTEMLGEAEGADFLCSYGAPRAFGLRLNQLKLSLGSAAEQLLSGQFGLRPVPWCPAGYYYEELSRPGKHPYHAAGLYYIQEPSAMSAAELLMPRPGETVLDLAAAPGGKTTQIAAHMQGEGVLISNEPHPQRAKILAENVERMGITNTVVTQATPPELASRFPAAFDRIMLDAPCSGEGMFRKDPEAMAEWSLKSVELCAARQWEILQDALVMLKPGGKLAYSTCTFNRQENEEMMQRLLAAHPRLKLIAEKRIWPHLQEGEGHYAALLELAGVDGEGIEDNAGDEMKRPQKGREARRGARGSDGSKDTAAAWEAFRQWADESLPGLDSGSLRGEPVLFGEALYLLPRSKELVLTAEKLSGLKVPRAGLELGELRKGRFQPAHALAMAARAESAAQHWMLDADSAETAAFLHGETLAVPPELRGWCLVTLHCGDESFPLGWGKASGGQLKNHLPKGLRRLQ